MPTLLPTLPHRRRSRRRARYLRVRILVGSAVLLLLAYSAWQPFALSTGSGTQPQPTAAAALLSPVRPVEEPEQSIDTEGALAESGQVTDATYYAAER